MKLSNLLLAAALFFSTGIAFAKPKNKNGDEESGTVEQNTPADFFGIENTENMKTLDIVMFRMNEGWNYSVGGYTATTPEVSEGDEGDEAEPTLVLTYSSKLGGSQNLEVKTKKKVQAYIEQMDEALLPDDEELLESLKGHTTSIYHFSVPVPDDVDEIGLMGGNGGGFTATIYNKAATNGNDFLVVGNAIYFGKALWVGSYNNGAVFMVGAGAPSAGSPLPTPVVTLLIALGFGAAFVMYRNRKQVKA